MPGKSGDEAERLRDEIGIVRAICAVEPITSIPYGVQSMPSTFEATTQCRIDIIPELTEVLISWKWMKKKKGYGLLMWLPTRLRFRAPLPLRSFGFRKLLVTSLAFVMFNLNFITIEKSTPSLKNSRHFFSGFR